jgi:hypothetical protein
MLAVSPMPGFSASRCYAFSLVDSLTSQPVNLYSLYQLHHLYQLFNSLVNYYITSKITIDFEKIRF